MAMAFFTKSRDYLEWTRKVPPSFRTRRNLAAQDRLHLWQKVSSEPTPPVIPARRHLFAFLLVSDCRGSGCVVFVTGFLLIVHLETSSRSKCTFVFRRCLSLDLHLCGVCIFVPVAVQVLQVLVTAATAACPCLERCQAWSQSQRP